MAELKGLLDSAKRKLGGLLGDFPAGFNSGAVAGIAGYPGDIAYMLDTAGRAITGHDTQPAAQDFPGTTDYIAAKAGYPIPGSFSGQLGAAVGGMLTPGPGDLGRLAPLGAMFLGAKAKTAMPDVLEYAQAMEKAGKSADEIWQTTGKLGQPWMKGADGKWRFEISDSPAQVPAMEGATLQRLIESDPSSKHGMGVPRDAALEDVLRHPELEAAYFQTREQTPSVMLSPIGGGQYTESDDLIRLNNGLPLDESALKSVTLHELQHAVQGREGFGRGGNSNQAFRDARMWGKDASSGSDVARKMLTDKLAEMRQVMPLEEYAKAAWGSDVVTKEIAEDYARNYVPTVAKPLSPDMERAAQETISKEWYKRLAGEAEARNVQARMNMSMDERIALPPWVTQDVPTERQIVRFGDGASMAIEDFAARRAGKAKPYREAVGADTMSAMSKPPETPEYGINHRPPMRSSGAPLYDATGGGDVYPDDVYSAKAQQYYGTGDAKLDRDTFRLLNAYKNEPDAPVTIYRAVPSDVDATDINPGDWVTINKAYADMHGKGFENGYKVIKKQVRARDIFTNGDSIHEWGYDPDGM